MYPKPLNPKPNASKIPAIRQQAATGADATKFCGLRRFARLQAHEGREGVMVKNLEVMIEGLGSRIKALA